MKILVAALLLVGATALASDSEYFGRRLYRHAVDQAVEGYTMSCLSQEVRKGWFNRSREGYECKAFNSGAHFLLEATWNRKREQLRSIDIMSFNQEAYSTDEKIIGEKILNRVLATAAETYGVSCKQLHDSMAICSVSGWGDDGFCRYRMRFECTSADGKSGMMIKAVTDRETILGSSRAQIKRIFFRPFGEFKKKKND